MPNVKSVTAKEAKKRYPGRCKAEWPTMQIIMYKLPNIAHAVTKQRTARQKYFSILKLGFKEKYDDSMTSVSAVVFVWFISMPVRSVDSRYAY